MRPVVLVTRPEPGLGETLAAVAGMGFDARPCPMLRITPRKPGLPRAASLGAILLTSAQAVMPLAGAAEADPALLRLTLLAVGDATAARARAAGFTACESAAGDAAALLGLVRARLAPGTALLLATGAGQGEALSRCLRQAGGYRLHRRVVYVARAPRALPVPARAALSEGRVAACLFFSAETARNFARLLPVVLHPSLRAIRALAISPAVGAALATLPWRSVKIASHPDQRAMLSLLDADRPG